MEKNSIDRAELETDSIDGEVRRTFHRAADEATRLGHVGDAAYEVVSTDAFPDLEADALEARATHLRVLALHTASLAIDLGAAAGKLEALATVRRSLIISNEGE